MDVTHFTYFIRALTPIMVGWLAWVIARAPLQSRANRLFALFLAVIATSFLLEFGWVTLTTEGVAGQIGAVLRDAQAVLGVVDPPLLLAAVLVYLGRLDLARRGALWAAFALAAVVVLAENRFALIGGDAGQVLEIAYVNGSYFVAFLLLALGHERETRAFRLVQFRFLAVGVGFVAISRSGALFGPGGMFRPLEWFPAGVLYALLVGMLLLAVAWIAVRNERRGPGLVRIFTALGLALLLFHLFWFIAALNAETAAGGAVYAAYFPLRWVVFGLIVGYGILRYQLFDFDLRVRQTLALGLAILVGVALGIVVGAAVHDPTGTARGLPLLPARGVGILVGLAVIPPLWWAAGAALRRVWPESDSIIAYRQRRLEIYQATLESAFAKPEWNPEERRFIETLREVFEVTEEEHKLVVKRLRAARAAATR